MSRKLVVISEFAKPPDRKDCENGQRPCPWTECRYHVGPIPDGFDTNCAMDMADRGPHTCEEIALFLGLTEDEVMETVQTARRNYVRAYEEEISKAKVRDPEAVKRVIGFRTAERRANHASRKKAASTSTIVGSEDRTEEKHTTDHDERLDLVS